MAKTGAMKLMVSLVERGQGNDLAKYYAEHNVNFNFRSVGIGTASSDLLDVLGIGSAEKGSAGRSDYRDRGRERRN